ncbi:hypothetical protein ABZ345_27920 [Lentzea sp. NPDC005914]|uniref:hypothetical protein n=1 Tax=Lentzea sp. NPDC005914 TaxID=3154572 RepID=UPI0033FFA698
MQVQPTREGVGLDQRARDGARHVVVDLPAATHIASVSSGTLYLAARHETSPNQRHDTTLLGRPRMAAAGSTQMTVGREAARIGCMLNPPQIRSRLGEDAAAALQGDRFVLDG